MNRAAKKRLTFDQWLDDTGIQWLAKTLRVHPQTVRQWRTRRCDPKVDHMRRIKKMTKGLVTYDMMIDRRPITTVGTYTGEGR